MAIASDIRSFLTGDTTVNGLVGSRVYPIKAPQPKANKSALFPHIVIVQSNLDTTMTNDGVSGQYNATLQIHCIDVTFDGSRAVADAVKNAQHSSKSFIGFRGQLTTYFVQGIFLDNESDVYIPATEFATEQGYHITQLDITVWFD